MAEENKPKNVADLIKQIEEFERTIAGLQANVDKLKKKLSDNRAKYGDDFSKWPKE